MVEASDIIGQAEPHQEEEVCSGKALRLPGPAGDIEVLVSCPECFASGSPIVVICHPHPLYGGSLRNKVVHILASSFNAMGLLSVTFNFRGVGHSEGEFDHGVGETDDLLAVVKAIRQRYPESPLWLAGFSFGAYVALRGHVDAAAERLLLVAPPVSMFDFIGLPEPQLPWMVVQGGRDEIVSPQAVSAWVAQRERPPEYHCLDDADHFFHGRLNRLRETLMQHWSRVGENKE